MFNELRKNWASFFILFVIFLGTPYLPDSILLTLDNLFIRCGSILLILWAITHGPLIGVIMFMVIANLYIERNQRKITSTKIQLYSEISAAMSTAEGADGLGNDGRRIGPEREATVDEEGVAQKAVPVLPFEIPSLGNIWRWNPKDACDGDRWSAVAPSFNAKAPTKTIDGGSKTWAFFIKKGVAGKGLGGGRVL